MRPEGEGISPRPAVCLWSTNLRSARSMLADRHHASAERPRSLSPGPCGPCKGGRELLHWDHGHACDQGDAGWGLPRAGLGPAAGRRLPFRTVQAQLRLTWMHAEKALPLEVGKESLRRLLPPARSHDLSPRVPSRKAGCYFGMTLRDPSVSRTTEVTLAMSAWPCWRSAASISSRVTRCRRRAASR